MDNFGSGEDLHRGSPDSAVIVIIERHILTRTCILRILKREFGRFELVEMAASSDLDRASGMDVCLIALGIGDKSILDACIENDLAAIARSFPHAPIALLSYRDDEATASAAMRRGVRGFFPTSIPVEVAIAGLRLVLAGGVYRPLPIDARPSETAVLKTLNASIEAHGPAGTCEVDCAVRNETQQTLIDLTPREKNVLAALELGLPNKLIASRLNLSENTVKMHIQHIMRKCFARNRTEAVLLCSGRLSRANGDGRWPKSA